MGATLEIESETEALAVEVHEVQVNPVAARPRQNRGEIIGGLLRPDDD